MCLEPTAWGPYEAWSVVATPSTRNHLAIKPMFIQLKVMQTASSPTEGPKDCWFCYLKIKIWSPTVCCWTKISNGPPFFTAFWGGFYQLSEVPNSDSPTKTQSHIELPEENGSAVCSELQIEMVEVLEKTRIRELNGTHGIPMDFVSPAIVTFQNPSILQDLNSSGFVFFTFFNYQPTYIHGSHMTFYGSPAFNFISHTWKGYPKFRSW